MMCRIAHDEENALSDGPADALRRNREAVGFEARARHVVDHLALLVAGEDRAVHRAHVAFGPDVGILDQEADGLSRFLFNRIDAAAAVGVDVGEVKLQTLHGVDHLAHAFNIGARSGRPRMPGNVDAHFVRDLNHVAAGFER